MYEDSTGAVDNRPRVTEIMEFDEGRTHVVARVTRISDPDAVARAKDFMAACIVRRLPEIMARELAREQNREAKK